MADFEAEMRDYKLTEMNEKAENAVAIAVASTTATRCNPYPICGRSGNDCAAGGIDGSHLRGVRNQRR